MSKEKLDVLIAKGYDFDIKEAFEKAWQLFLAQPVLSISYTLLILSIQLLFVVYLKDFTLLYSILLAPPFFSGFYLAANKINQNQPVIYPDFFRGFMFFLPVVSIWLIGQILTFFGIVLLVIPGIYLMVAYSFAVLMAIFGGFDFWNALEASRKLITVRWWKFFLLTLILIVMNFLGLLLFGMGLLVTVPMTFYVTYVIFEDLTKDVFSE
ncbi:hypothetical protein P872_24930 [Rhodonellum psychrophilum GCM71 = DSM 17998]|uniref:Glycerophosphoryl diester phosphodiesterase membrane domain-containing protein n=2 Tax=Rhodonellum TaxID=336827 RepID=U5C3N4_9BACT|nr:MULTISPECIES: hypothetical protein [Rhodonellum]ERM84404.1 hypothetical protein P872_24930 [Rhodonellum psychrophilum GCM71 = DSM 17998]MDO9553989.1 hypothetical protein [Rhodonellum sp.]SDY99323.1 hypothetical protein SAMN05444412_104220 [Rhodonellum ikkaensis]